MHHPLVAHTGTHSHFTSHPCVFRLPIACAIRPEPPPLRAPRARWAQQRTSHTKSSVVVRFNTSNTHISYKSIRRCDARCSSDYLACAVYMRGVLAHQPSPLAWHMCVAAADMMRCGDTLRAVCYVAIARLATTTTPTITIAYSSQYAKLCLAIALASLVFSFESSNVYETPRQRRQTIFDESLAYGTLEHGPSTTWHAHTKHCAHNLINVRDVECVFVSVCLPA